MFRDINELTGNREENKQISLLIDGGDTVDDGGTVADLFNEYLTIIAGDQLEQFDHTWMKFSFAPALNSIFLFPVGNREAEKFFTAPNPNKSTRLNGLSVKKLKSMLPVISQHVTMTYK